MSRAGWVVLGVCALAGRPALGQEPDAPPADGAAAPREDSRCDALADSGLAEAVATELGEDVDELVLEPIPCGEAPFFYRMQLGGRVHYLDAPPEGSQRHRVLALAIAHYAEEHGLRLSSPPSPDDAEPVPEPWTDSRPLATEADVYRWFPTRLLFERERAGFGMDASVGAVGGRGGGGALALALRGRLARALTLGVESEALLGRRDGDDFRTFTTWAFVGLDSRWFGAEVLGGVLTPRRGESTLIAPTFGLRLLAGVPDSISFTLTLTFAATTKLKVDQLAAEVTGPVTLRTRFRFRMAGALRAGHARSTLVFEHWLRGYGGSDSVAVGGEIGILWLWSDELCEFGACDALVGETSGRRAMGGLLLQLITRKRF